jgi:hypothetical protein
MAELRRRGILTVAHGGFLAVGELSVKVHTRHVLIAIAVVFVLVLIAAITAHVH